MMYVNSCHKPHPLLVKMSTGEPSLVRPGQPLNCQAGPATNTATTCFLRGREREFSRMYINVILLGRFVYQSSWLSLVGLSVRRYGMETVCPGCVGCGFLRWITMSVCLLTPARFLSSDRTNLEETLGGGGGNG